MRTLTLALMTSKLKIGESLVIFLLFNWYLLLFYQVICRKLLKLICLSFATRLNLETLAKGQKEGVGLEIIQTILKRIVQMPFRDNSWLTTLMEKYFERYKKLLPKCVDRTMGLSDFKIWTWNLTPNLTPEKFKTKCQMAKTLFCLYQPPSSGR